MRWSRRDGPTGSHQLDASALKCDTSVGSTVDLEGCFAEEEVVEEKRIGDVYGDAKSGACGWVDVERYDEEVGCLRRGPIARINREAFIASSVQ
jgi:hypothetical protein